MKIQIRNNRIKKSKSTIKDIAKKYGFSYERARQIKLDLEQKEKQQVEKIRKEYQKQVKNLIREDLPQEIKRLSNKGRSKKIIIQKVILIRSLRDNFNFTFSRIAKLFKNDYSTIRHLYFSSNE